MAFVSKDLTHLGVRGFVLVLVLVLVLDTSSHFEYIFSFFDYEDENDDEDDWNHHATRTPQLVTRNPQPVTRNPLLNQQHIGDGGPGRHHGVNPFFLFNNKIHDHRFWNFKTFRQHRLNLLGLCRP